MAYGRLPRVTGVKMIRAFRKAGWIHERTNGDHFIFIHPERPNALVQIQYHNRDLTTGLIGRIESQSGYTRIEFIDVIRGK